MEKDVSDGVKEFFGDGSLLKELNSTFIMLIPKCVRSDSMNNFRPIRQIIHSIRLFLRFSCRCFCPSCRISFLLNRMDLSLVDRLWIVSLLSMRTSIP